MTHLTLRTLGACEVRRAVRRGATDGDGESSPRFGASKPLALITYLAHAPRRTALRDHLVELLWDDVDPALARQALRQTLWSIKRTLGPDTITAKASDLVLTASIESDALDFLAAIDRRDAEGAIALYAGEFLPAIALPGGAEFERWADVERVRLRSMYTRSAEEVAHRLLSAGRSREALAVSRKARDADPDDERLWRRVLEAHLAASDLVGACVEADSFERIWLENEREPDPSTLTLLRQSRQAAPSPGSDDDHPKLVAALIGRSAEFATLTAAWDEVQRGEGASHVHIVAAAGLGKSRLLADLRARLRAARSRVVMLRAKQGERQIPFAFAAELAASLAKLPGGAAVSPAVTGVLVELNPALSSVYPRATPATSGVDSLRPRTIAIRELLAAVSDDTAVALLVDDLHWMDSASRDVVAALGSDLGSTRALLVTASRGDARQHFVSTSSLISLAPLDEQGTLELVASLAELPNEPWVDLVGAPLLAATGGSPLLILELLQLALEKEALSRAGGRWSCARPEELKSLVLQANPLSHRLSRLPADERDLIECMAIAGIPLSVEVLLDATNGSEAAVRAMLHALESRGLVTRQSEDVWAPSHDEVAAGSMTGLTDQLAAARRLLVGRALAARAVTEHDARIAAGVLVEVRSVSDLTSLLLARLHAARGAGHRPRAIDAWHDLAGSGVDPAITGAVMARLPYRLRHPRVMVTSVMAAMLVVAAIGGAAALRPRSAMTLHFGQIYTDSVIAGSASIPFGTIVADEPIELSSSSSRLPQVVLSSPQPTQPSPDGRGWYTWRAFPDSGGLDLTLIDRAGAETRLTRDVGDDESPIPSPDGRELLFKTTRYDSTMKANIALFSVKTKSVREFMGERFVYDVFAWSPDGSRVAVARVDPRGGNGEICVSDADGTHGHCSGELSVLVGWLDESTLLASRAGEENELYRVDADSLVTSPTNVRVRRAELSPDRKWILAQGRKTGYDGYVFWIAPANEPVRTSVLEWHHQPVRAAHVLWDLERPSLSYVERLRINAPDTIRNMAAIQLSAEAFDARGGRARVGIVRWFSLDSSVASVTPSGLLVPAHAGIARVVATAGGWRADTARIVVHDAPVQLLMRSDWSNGQATSDWMFFGDPAPAFVSDEHRTVLHLDGDSSFSTGIRLAKTLSLRDGVAVRARLKILINAPRWQFVSLAVRTAASDSLWLAWDRRTGDLPQAPDIVQLCNASYPSDEGIKHEREWTLGSSDRVETGAVSPAMAEGRWFWMELQVLPDGRCGLAIDGVPRALSLERQPAVARSEVTLEAKSVRTRVLTDSIEVYRGIVHPAWWAAMDAKRRR